MEQPSPGALPTVHTTVSEFRFKEYERLSLTLSLIITCLGPLLTFVQDLLLNPHLAGLSLRIGLCSMGILGLYPLALGLALSRRLIQAIAILSPSIVVCMDLLLRADQPGDVTRSIVLLLYLIAYARILALPFGLPVTISSIAMLLLIPLALMVSGLLPGLSAVRILIPLIPMALMMFLLELLLTRNLHETHRQRKQLEDMAIQDPLTGLNNRRYFVLSASEHLRIAARSGRPLCILMVDLDHFKRINDTFGHATGDQVIRLTSDVLRHELRASDVLARFGGEEFIACLPDTEQAAAMVAAERIRSNLEKSALQGPQGADSILRVTASIGIAAAGAGTDTLEMLIERADRALYESKRGGRNRVTCAA
ncbi:hypothetical protein GETHPA_12590 [Geothrix rubra]|uniref:diguanylate cyclase n=1 Tax=Geothrix rubra TaxID=2927977 RepID=A0ABQ5Q5P4_9BACT|nr:GGDEF domain-containing protein [Geothrix rubra]GLH69726.1 hypothetical protein GETHPA_12590 [Geothrix rubra]